MILAEDLNCVIDTSIGNSHIQKKTPLGHIP